MVYDLNNDGFETFEDFLNYAEGAAVCPGAIFMHLCGVYEKMENIFRQNLILKKLQDP